MRGLFVTGTDTGVGKTRVAEALLLALAARGERAIGVKPVAAGCRVTANGLRNEDALILQAAGNVALSYEQVNPIALQPAVAPHLAAEDAGVVISVNELAGHVRALEQETDWLLVEGAGGWRVPLGPDCGFPDLARRLGYPVVLVAGIRLGCINHALLTADAVRADGLHLAGWVANGIVADEPLAERQVTTLAARLHAPLLGHLGFQREWNAARASQLLDTDPLVWGAD